VGDYDQAAPWGFTLRLCQRVAMLCRAVEAQTLSAGTRAQLLSSGTERLATGVMLSRANKPPQIGLNIAHSLRRKCMHFEF
jgi:hypothetical protein